MSARRGRSRSRTGARRTIVDDDISFRSRSPVDVQNQPSVSVHGQERDEISELRTEYRSELSAIQASLAELNRKMTSAENVQGNIPLPMTNFQSVMTSNERQKRIGMDELPPTDNVPSNLRQLIKEHKYINLALLLLPVKQSENETRIIDQSGSQIVVKSNDQRLTRKLNIDEFRTAFNLYKDVILDDEDSRRKELDTYLQFIDKCYNMYGGTHFYDYHVQFAKKAEEYESRMKVPVDWSLKNTSLYLEVFAGLKSRTCDICHQTDHTSGFCPSNNSGPTSHLTSQSRFTSHGEQASLTFGNSYNRGTPKRYHNGKEICNKFNSDIGCTWNHNNFFKIIHVCANCRSPTHSSIKCTRRSSNKQN